MEDNYKVHDLDDIMGKDFYMVETLTQFVVYEHLYDSSLRIRRWRVSKEIVPYIDEAMLLWTTTLN